MPDVPNTAQLVLLGLSLAAFLGGIALSFARMKWADDRIRLAAKICLYSGIMMGIGVLVWHCANRGSWLPLEDNFDTLIWLALLLALFVAYTQFTRPLRGLDWFVLPIVALLLIGAAVFGRSMPHQYLITGWFWLHRVSAFGGALAFAVAGAAGGMYLLASYRLRSKRMAPAGAMGSLERLEHLTLLSITLGFGLLTIGLITGVVRALGGANPLGPQWYIKPKVLLTFIAWVVYALVLHSPINPSFRGRKVALLSVVGFVLIAGALVAAQWMPGK